MKKNSIWRNLQLLTSNYANHYNQTTFFEQASKIASIKNKLYFNHQHQTFRFINLAGKSTQNKTQQNKKIWADAVISNQTSTLVYMNVADCFPIILYEPNQKVFALIHAGFKPLAQNIIELTAMDLKYHLGIKPKNLLAWIGPGIQKCCYQFKNKPWLADLSNWKKVIKEMKAYKLVDKISNKGNKNNQKVNQSIKLWQINLQQFIINELLKLGLNKNKLQIDGTCTCCATDSQNKPLYHSHRRFSLGKEGQEGRNFVGVVIDHSNFKL